MDLGFEIILLSILGLEFKSHLVVSSIFENF